MINSGSPEQPSEIIEGPTLEVCINGRERIFHWQNCLLRTFLTGLGEYDHIEYKDDDGRVVGIPMTAPGATAIRQFMEDYRFPFRVDPIVDEATAIWYAETKANELDEQWQNMDVKEP